MGADGHTVERIVEKQDLLVLGVYRASEGYPNVLYRLEVLRESERFSIREINVPFWREGLMATGVLKGFFILINAVWAHVSLLARYLKEATPKVLYVPYPAISVLPLLSLLPTGCWPRHIVVDAYISIYDTVVNDRRLLGKGNPLARFIWRVERWAYNLADVVVADTSENAAYLCKEFDLHPSKVRVVVLSTNERHFRPARYLPNQGIFRVLFIGTFVPLHGVRTIIDAAILLKDCKEITFHLIGDGQAAGEVQVAIRNNDIRNIVWTRDWQSPESIAEEIWKADICLGIFGDTVKAQRVCPLKIYAYAAVGRPVITGHTEWLCKATTGLEYAPFATVPISNAEALANKILSLMADWPARAVFAKNSRRFYEAALSNQVANAKFIECLNSVRT